MCKGHFQTAPDTGINTGRQAEMGLRENEINQRAADKYIHCNIADQGRSGKYHCENRISLKGFKIN